MTTSLACTEIVESPAPDFNRLARVYRWMEWLTFGPFLQRCRSVFLARLTDRRRGLILGDGDGRFTARLLELNSGIDIDAVDASKAMLRQLTGRANSSRVHSYHTDIRSFQPPQSRYDLIASHFFLDCLTNLEVGNLALRLRDHCSPKAIWLISDFAIPSSFFGRMVARPLISALYLAFAMLTDLRTRKLPNHSQALKSSGWRLVDRRQHLSGLLVSELWQVDRPIELHGSGNSL